MLVLQCKFFGWLWWKTVQVLELCMHDFGAMFALVLLLVIYILLLLLGTFVVGWWWWWWCCCCCCCCCWIRPYINVTHKISGNFMWYSVKCRVWGECALLAEINNSLILSAEFIMFWWYTERLLLWLYKLIAFNFNHILISFSFTPVA
jgi:hypothetical protein